MTPDDFWCNGKFVVPQHRSSQAPFDIYWPESDLPPAPSGNAGETIDAGRQTFSVRQKSRRCTNLLGSSLNGTKTAKRSINATDQFQMQGMIGDRATVKEVWQRRPSLTGLNLYFIANIETAMAAYA